MKNGDDFINCIYEKMDDIKKVIEHAESFDDEELPTVIKNWLKLLKKALSRLSKVSIHENMAEYVLILNNATNYSRLISGLMQLNKFKMVRK